MRRRAIKRAELTDRERILMSIVSELDSSQLLAQGRTRYYKEDFSDGHGGYYAHFAHYRDPLPGDLVLCQTSGIRGPHPWLIAWYVEGHGDTAMLREIGTERLCKMGNEKFVPIVEIRPLSLLEGEQHLFRNKVMRAFAKGNEYLYRFGGLSFPEKWVCRIWIREAHGGLLAGKDLESVPFSFDMPFGKRTTITAILAAMRAAGYGTRVFEHQPLGVKVTP